MAKSTPTISKKVYNSLYKKIIGILNHARQKTYQTVNAVLTATYWQIGKQIVELEQKGKHRAEYGEQLLKQLGKDLTASFGRGFSSENLRIMRRFYIVYSNQKSQTLSRISTEENPFPLSWSHYVRLILIEDATKRFFYETESLKSCWSVRQLDRETNSGLYERSVFPKSIKPKKAVSAQPDNITFKDPYILEFLNLPQNHSEKDLESALIKHMTGFLLELGFGFTFVARQKRLQIGSESYYIDLLLYHRQLRCFVVIDLKIGKFSHADVGQMNLYLNYLKENERLPDENQPIGLILCTEKDTAVVHYALGGLSNNVFASRYKLILPKPTVLEKELEKKCKYLHSKKC